jgi:hypothetical protein
MQLRISVMLRTSPGAGDKDAVSVLPVLDKFKSVSDVICQSILSKYGAGIQPYFEGTSAINKPRLARYYTITNAPKRPKISLPL